MRRLSAYTLALLLALAVALPSAADVVACYDHGHGYNAHGWISNGGDPGAAEYVTLHTYGSSWVGDRYELLTVRSVHSWSGSGSVSEVTYTLPSAGTAYYGDERNVISWTVCKGTTPATTTSTTTSQPSTTTTQPTTTTEVPPSSTTTTTPPTTTVPDSTTTTTSTSLPTTSTSTASTTTTPSTSSSVPAPTTTAPTTPSTTVQISQTSITPPVQVDDTWPVTYTTPDVLPSTGVDAGALVAGAAALILLGGLMVAGRKEGR